MNIRKNIVVLLIATMLMGLLPSTTFAVSSNSVNKVVRASEGEELHADTAPQLNIQLKDPLTSGSVFYLTLDGATWADHYKESTMLEEVKNNEDEVISTIIALRENDQDLKVITSGSAIALNTVITVPLACKVRGGEATVEVDGHNSTVDSGKYVFAKTDYQDKMEVGFGYWRDYPLYTEGTIAPISIEEAYMGQLKYWKTDEERTITIKMENPNFEFDPPSLDNIILQKGFSVIPELKEEMTIRYGTHSDQTDNKKEIELILPKLTDDILTQRGGIVLEDLMIRSTIANPTGLEDIEVTVDGLCVEKGTKRVARVEPYSNSLQILLPEYFHLVDGRKQTISFSLAENADGSMFANEEIKFNFEGAFLSNDKVDHIRVRMKHNEETSRLLNLPVIKDNNGYATGFKFNTGALVKGKRDTFLFEDLEIYRPLGSYSGLRIEADGIMSGNRPSDGINYRIQPVNVSVDKVNVRPGTTQIRNQQISITENINGAFQEGPLVLSFAQERGIKFSKIPKVVVLGNIEVGQAKITEGELVIPITKGSTKNSALKITDIELAIDGKVRPASLYVGGEALTKDGCTIGKGIETRYIEVDYSEGGSSGGGGSAGGGGGSNSSGSKPKPPTESIKPKDENKTTQPNDYKQYSNRDNAIVENQNKNMDFKDISTTHWAYNSIKDAIVLGIVAGMPDGKFEPNLPLQVADTFTFLDRVLLLNNVVDMKLPRSTVETYIKNQDHWAFLHMASIGSKLEESTLKTISKLGNKEISRQLLAQVLYEITNGELPKTRDKKDFIDLENLNYKEAIDYCVQVGLLSGTSQSTLEPERALTRAELMSVIVRLNNLLNK